MFVSRSGYAKIVFALFLSSFFLVVFVSYSIIRSVTSSKHIASVSTQVVRKQWKERKDYREFVVFTDDKVAVKGVVFERQNPQRIILGCHGHRQSKESLSDLVDLFPNDVVVLFDFRAHGESEGLFVSFGYHERKDIAAVVSFVQKEYGDMRLPLFGLGFSMGAASLIGAAAKGVQFSGLVLNSSFSSLDGQIAHVFEKETGLPRIPFMFVVKLLTFYLLDFQITDVMPASWIKAVACPVSIVHASDDGYVLVDSADILSENACNLIDYWRLESGGHRRAVSVCPDEYLLKCESFFSAC